MALGPYLTSEVSDLGPYFTSESRLHHDRQCVKETYLTSVLLCCLFILPIYLFVYRFITVQYFFANLHVTAPLNFTTMVQPHRDTAVYHDVVPLCDSTRHSTQGCP